MHTIRVTITGANQFTDAGPVVEFTEFEAINSLGPEYAAFIIAMAYNSEGAAQTVVATLRPPGSSAESEFIEIYRDTNVNAFDYSGGYGRRWVPRNLGMAKTGTVVTGLTETFLTTYETYQLFFETTGKNDDGCLTVQFDIRSRWV